MKLHSSIIFFASVFLFFLSSQTNSPAKVMEEASFLQKNYRNLFITAPICLDRSDIPANEMHWLYMPKLGSELATNEYYGFLAGQLIKAGAVDASDCPLNGLWPSGYANSCGLEKSHQLSVRLQNIYDDDILAAGKGVGVPPVMIKQLIRYESQFWPGQMGPYHFGLGHLTYVGASNALLWNPSLFGNTAIQMVSVDQSGTVNWSNQLLSIMDASCPTCTEKVNIPKAKQSINYIAEVLFAYCRQTSQVVYNATQKNSSSVIDYPTIWKLTLLNYNVGPLCVYNAVNASYQDIKGDNSEDSVTKLSWDLISRNVSKDCSRGVGYVENITRPYYDFKISP